jgi:WhiB family redox-sensing transcriptional regulator
MGRAACSGLDPDLFYPERGGSSRAALAVCATCPVRQDCLEHALAHGEVLGVWGGLSIKERKRLRRRATPVELRRPA